MKTVLTAETLGELNDGLIGAAINDAIAACLRDCEDRPLMEAARSVSFDLTFAPIPDVDGGLMGVRIAASVKSPRIPAMKVPAQTFRTEVRRGAAGEVVGVEALFVDPWQEKLPLEPGAQNTEAN